MFIWVRHTRLYEGPGERFEGRVSSIPIVGVVHYEDCPVALRSDTRTRTSGLTEMDLVGMLVSDGVSHRHVIGCPTCGTHEEVPGIRVKVKNRS